MKLQEAISGYLLDAQARRLSPNTIADYRISFRKLEAFMGEAVFESITPDQLRQFLGSLPGSAKTILNVHIGLSALWTWAVSESIVAQNIVRGVRAPKPDSRVINPFTGADIQAMLKSCAKTTYTKNGKQVSCILHSARRNRAIVLFLLDTGTRASELCDCRIEDCDLTNCRVRVMGKGRKERFIDFDARTAKAVWRYLATRPGSAKSDWLFVTNGGRKMTRSQLTHLLRAIGKRAGVPNAHAHRYRHTYAIMSIVNGMDAFTLQTSLGHSSMRMTQRYLQFAQADISKIQRRSSPVANLTL